MRTLRCAKVAVNGPNFRLSKRLGSEFSLYNQYVVYNEIAGDNDLLNICLQCVSDKETYMIPTLKDDDEQTTSEDSDS